MNFAHIFRISTAQALAAMILLFFVAGCAFDSGVAGEPPATEATTLADDDAIPVAALPMFRGRIESVLRFSTNLEAENRVDVLAEAERHVTDLLVEEGDTVRAGQTMLLLEDEAQRTALKRVESQLERSRLEYERQKRLFEQDLISEQAYNQARYDMEQLELALEDAERELGYATVAAPISGVVTERLINVGDHVETHAKLFEIVDFDSIVARVFVPERQLAGLFVGQPARVLAQSLAGSREAAIERISPVVDPQSGTVKVTLGIPGNQGLLPGMYVEVDLVAAALEDTLLAPKRALVYDQEQVFVFRVAQGDDGPRAERLLVRILIESEDVVHLEGDLADGERLIVAGQAGLKDGARVRLLDPREALGSGAELGAASTPTYQPAS
ncbi:MAG: efflux RND transporter periplasmic adaptor subunit [Acidobacteriota bacterium]|nr:efflux RND transporter periplasmic adaptor subunit [Acidobacteriota bacterium]MDE2924111.1 efflux RND transporter periplasmic adaptor subunit [Acidobacteriota bacterium]MDE3265073.1 efflux RND transporter periplasmic adaptor subunit [Acidobacteriota bacterium]